jgi:hypothetical protein
VAVLMKSSFIIALVSRLLPLSLSGARWRQAALHYANLSPSLRASLLTGLTWTLWIAPSISVCSSVGSLCQHCCHLCFPCLDTVHVLSHICVSLNVHSLYLHPFTVFLLTASWFLQLHLKKLSKFLTFSILTDLHVLK